MEVIDTSQIPSNGGSHELVRSRELGGLLVDGSLRVDETTADGALLTDPARRDGPRIGRIELANGQVTLSQDEVLALLGMRGDEFAERIFRRCGVRRRHLSLAGNALASTLQERTPQLEEELFQAATRAVDALAIEPRRIGTVITGTLYSLGGPTLAHRIVDRCELDPETDKYHVLGVGCASAVPLLRLAGQCLRGHPGKQVLVVAAESMSGLMVRAIEDDPRAKVIGSAIFGDGCAAALLDGDPDAEGPVIVDSKVHQISGTLGAVRMELAAHNSYLHLERDLPDRAGDGLNALAREFVRRNGLRLTDIDHWMVHPGGRRIIESVQEALKLSTEQVAVSWDVLANYGNVGTPSIFYVLEQTARQRMPSRGERGLLVTIGPGVTVGLMLLQW